MYITSKRSRERKDREEGGVKKGRLGLKRVRGKTFSLEFGRGRKGLEEKGTFHLLQAPGRTKGEDRERDEGNST